MYIFFLVLVVLYMLVPTVDALAEKKKPKGFVVTEKMQCKKYCSSIAFLWGSVLIVFIMCFIGRINLGDIGFRKIRFNYNIGFTVIILIMSGLILAYSLSQIFKSLTNAKFKEEIKKQVGNGKGASGILPRNKKERRLFALLSFSAGICEEILYRGFMVFLLQAIFPDIPIYFIILLPNVLFGIGHLAQGLQNATSIVVGGVFFMCFYLVSGSLIPVMLLHFLFDFSNTFMLTDEQIK